MVDKNKLRRRAEEEGIPYGLALQLIQYDALKSPNADTLAAATEKRMNLLRKLYRVKPGEFPEIIGSP